MDENTNQAAPATVPTAEQPEQQEQTPAEAEVPAKEEKPEKTYTQAEVNTIVEKRLKRERLSAEEKADKALKEISALKTRNACYKLGIKDSCIDDAVALAEKLVDDKTDISAALAKVLEKYPVFGAEKPKPAVTGVHTEATHETDDSSLRKAFGLPSKKQ